MDQTGFLGFLLLVAFVMFVTVRGELPTYIGIVTGNVKG